MGLSVFPAPSTGPQIPAGLRPPRITFNQEWSLTGVTGINGIGSASGRAMTYRPTDNSLYFTATGNTSLWRFDLTTNTASRVTTSFFNSADIVAAQNGTLYSADLLGNQGVGSASNYRRSTDGGVTWTGMGTSGSQTRGWLTVLDNGSFSGITGNVMFATRFDGSQGASSQVVINDSNTNLNNRYYDYSDYSNVGGGGLFPVRDGDDSPTNAGRFVLTSSNSSTAQSSVIEQSGTIHLRYASLGVFREASAFRIQITENAPGFTVATFNRPIISSTNIGRPTSIQNRWIVGINKNTTSGPCFYIHDYANMLSLVESAPVRMASAIDRDVFSSHFSNPIYISATKKLYVFYNSTWAGSSGDARMQEYNVETY